MRGLGIPVLCFLLMRKCREEVVEERDGSGLQNTVFSFEDHVAGGCWPITFGIVNLVTSDCFVVGCNVVVVSRTGEWFGFFWCTHAQSCNSKPKETFGRHH